MLAPLCVRNSLRSPSHSPSPREDIHPRFEAIPVTLPLVDEPPEIGGVGINDPLGGGGGGPVLQSSSVQEDGKTFVVTESLGQGSLGRGLKRGGGRGEGRRGYRGEISSQGRG